MGIIALAMLILIIVGQWRIFEKAGLQGWEAIIPFYNSYCMSKIVLGNGWLFLVSLIPGIGTIFLLVLRGLLAHVFGKDVAFCIGTAILPGIFIPIIGLGDAEYKGSL